MENMKTLVTSAAIAALAAGSAQAAGLDRSGQFLGDLFAEGNVLKFSYGKVMPSVSGTDATDSTIRYDNVAQDYTRTGLSLKTDINDAFSFALILDEPFGADVVYPGDGATSQLGGLSAKIETQATTLVGRYKFGNGFSVHAGLRSQSIEGSVNLSGIAYGGLNSYNLQTSKGRETGYLVGAAYERPDIALRVALTYNSAIDYSLTGTEVLLDGTTPIGTYELKTSSPESLNLEFQTGVAANTLVFGSIRYAKWGDFEVPQSITPPFLSGANLASLDDTVSYNIGVARRFSDQFAGSISITYEASGDGLVSPLSATDGLLGISIGGAYDVSDQITVSGGINYSAIGDATPDRDGTVRANFTDNSAVGVGFSVAYKF